MKYLILCLGLALLVAACSGAKQDDNAIPQDLAGKKALLRQKQAELNALTQFVAQLQAEVDSLDPSIQVNKHLVTVLPVTRGTFEHFVEIQGTIAAEDMVDATSEVPGRIVNLTVKEGQNIQRGQLIAKIDLEQVQKQIAELETSLSLAKTVYERQKRLWDQNIGSELQYLEAKNNKERLEKNLDLLQLQLSKANVYAPVSGVIERVVLHAGEVASPGMPIVQILNTNQLKAVASVPENYIAAVRKGEKVTITIPSLQEEIVAAVTQIGRVVDPGNRTFAVEAAIPNKGGLLKPNLVAIVLIKDQQEPNVVTVPLDLVQQEVSGRKYVFIAVDGDKVKIARKVYVETGKSYKGKIVITTGLQGGEVLIADGARGLGENEEIEIQNTKTELTNG